MDGPAGKGCAGDADPAMRICALIPAYNEADIIGDLVTAVRPQVAEVIVVDDGSKDGTGDRASQAGAVCLRLEQEPGEGRCRPPRARAHRAGRLQPRALHGR